MHGLVSGLPDIARPRMLAAGASALVATLMSGCVEPVTAAPADVEAEVTDTLLRLDAEGLPIVRAGLWEVVDQSDDQPPRTERRCLTRAFHGAADEVLSLMVAEGCSKDRKSDAHTLHVVATCERADGYRMVSDYAYRGAPTDYALIAKVSISRSGKGPAVARGKGRGRWLGDCPGHMVPGDVMESGG